jgi:hypothetical protein
VEGGWSSRLTDRESVKGLLRYLGDVGKARYIHRTAHTVDEALHVLAKWPQRQYERFQLGYLGFHGEAGNLLLGRKRLTLQQLGEHLAGSLNGKTVYFGSCSVLAVAPREVQQFKKTTGAKCVAGYTRDVCWFESAAFDMLLFEALTRYKRSDAVERWLRSNYGGRARNLGFKMYYG